MDYWVLDLQIDPECETHLPFSRTSQSLEVLKGTIKCLTAKDPRLVGLKIKKNRFIPDSVDEIHRLYDQLKGLEENEDSNEKSEFRGLFVVIPDALQHILSLVMDGPLPYAIESLRIIYTKLSSCIDYLNRDAASIEIADLFLLLDLIASRSRVVLFTSTPTKCSKHWNFSVESLDAKSDIPRYLLSRIGRDLYRFAPLVNEIKDNRFVAKGQNNEDFPLSCKVLETEYWDWFRQEFGTRRLAQAFLGYVWGTLCNRKIPEKGEEAKDSMLPWHAQVAIGVARMCRRMSTWTLEGAPFECAVVLQPDVPSEHLRAVGSRFRSLIDIVPTCPFTFDFEDEVRGLAETAQSDALFLLVYAGDGHLHNVATAIGSAGSIRHRYYAELAKHYSMVFRIRPPGRVDLYTTNGLAMTFDGFKWIDDPFGRLRKAVARHFKGIATGRDECVDRIQEATQILLDRSESSIFILVHPKDKHEAQRLTSEALRPQIVWSTTSMIRVDDFEPAALAGLLHLDGAHLIDEKGGLISISRRINAKGARHSINIDFAEYRFIKDKEFHLPRGASVDETFNRSEKPPNIYWLMFTSRVEPKWLEEWFQHSRWLKGQDGLKKKIEDAIVQELRSYKVALFQPGVSMSWNAIDEVRAPFVSTLRLGIGGKKGILFLNDQIDAAALMQKFKERIEIKQFYFFESRLPYSLNKLPSTESIEGLAVASDSFYVEIDSFASVLNNPNLDGTIHALMASWDRSGPSIDERGPGTGTRAAQELSAKLPHSKVVKVSSSGKLKFYEFQPSKDSQGST